LTLLSLSLERFLSDLSSASPTPGGGSAAALGGAMGSALLLMVLRITLKKAEEGELKKQLEQSVAEIQACFEELEKLIDEDAAAFDAVMSAFKLPKESEEQKEFRKGEIQKYLKTAAEVPMRTARVCGELAKLSVGVAEGGEAKAISDVGTAAGLIRAGFEGAKLNVRINLSAIKDSEFVERFSQELEQINHSILSQLEKTKSFMERRME
jgi:formiminotetrahydrofolate cyclodeaminase